MAKSGTCPGRSSDDAVRQPSASPGPCGEAEVGREIRRAHGAGECPPVKKGMAILVDFSRAVSARHAHGFESLVKAAYAAGIEKEDLLTAVETGQLLGDPPGPIVEEAYATVHAWQWMANRRAPRGREPASCVERRSAERRETWLQCTTRS